MHEIGIARSILDAVEHGVRDPGRARGVSVLLGPFSGVNRDALCFAFEVLAPESACPRARLLVTEAAAAGDCPACGAGIPLPVPTPVCPRCGAPLAAVHGGDDITLLSVTLDERGEPCPNP
jgi:hydrogenase nickel incorporation protein HypA/HybF